MDNHLLPELVTIPGGRFFMGSGDGQENERPVHEVYVSTFRIAVVPVTNAHYAPFVEAHPDRKPKKWDHPRFSAPDQPVVAVSWFDAVAYCEWLAAKTGISWRLPTEAQRERAARGGVGGRAFPWGDERPAWAEADGYCQNGPARVGQDPPNGFGLHNMGDLVHEWCADWFDPDYYGRSPESDPAGPIEGERRASRGGSWRHQVKVTRCAARSSLPPDRTFTDYGFRIVTHSTSE